MGLLCSWGLRSWLRDRRRGADAAGAWAGGDGEGRAGAVGTGADQAGRGMSAGHDGVPGRALRQAGDSPAEHRRLSPEVHGRRRPAPGAAREVPGRRHPQPPGITADNIEQMIKEMDSAEPPRAHQSVGRQRRSAEALDGDDPQQPLRGSLHAVRQRGLRRAPAVPGWKERAVAQVEGVKNGAIGFKVFKNLGLSARKADGSRLEVDDPDLDPIWQALRPAEHSGAHSRRRSGAVLGADRLPQRALARAERCFRAASIRRNASRASRS